MGDPFTGSETVKFVEQRMGGFSAKARLQLKVLREDFRKKTEDYESLRSQLVPEIQKILLPTFALIGSEAGRGCATRMRFHLREGISNSMREIHETVSSRVLNNWGEFIKEACAHTEMFVRFIKDWLVSIQQLPTPQNNEALELKRQYGNELIGLAEKLLRGPAWGFKETISETEIQGFAESATINVLTQSNSIRATLN